MAENIYIDKFGPSIPNNPPPGQNLLNPAIVSGSSFGLEYLGNIPAWVVPVERWKPQLPDLYLLSPKLPGAIYAGAFFYSADQDDVVLAMPMPDKWMPELPDLYLGRPTLCPAIQAGSLFQESKAINMAFPSADKWMPELPDLYLQKPTLIEAIKAIFALGDIPRSGQYVLRTVFPSTYFNTKITAFAVDSMDIVYFGTEVGEVYKYNWSTFTKLAALDGAIESIGLYGNSLLYLAVKGGKIYSLTTS